MKLWPVALILIAFVFLSQWRQVREEQAQEMHEWINSLPQRTAEVRERTRQLKQQTEQLKTQCRSGGYEI